MAFLREREIRTRAQQYARTRNSSVQLLMEQSAKSQSATHYDVFLSQTIKDAEIVLGVYLLLTEKGLKVFCDWLDSPKQDRSSVTPSVANYIRTEMSRSDTFLFLDTESANQSRWMPWELGWFDGRKGHVAVLPILPDHATSYRGREFLGLYPYVQLDSRGELEVIRPVLPSQSGVSIFEAPNSRSLGVWRADKIDFFRPRTPI